MEPVRLLMVVAVAATLASWSGCLVSADEGLWQRHDGRPGEFDRAASDGAVPDRRATERPAGEAPRSDLPFLAADRGSTDHGATDTPGGCGELALRVQADADDGEIDWGAGKLYLGGEAGPPAGIRIGVPAWGYFRFALGQPIPKGATVTGATLTLQGAGLDGWNSADQALAVWAELAADPPPVSSVADNPLVAGGRPLTQAKARWPSSGGLSWANGPNSTPSLVALLQEIVNTSGLVAGGHVQLWLSGAQMSAGSTVAVDFSANPLQAATLAVSWCK